ERLTFDTVVFTCCDMLSACELVSDIERAAQWCQVADDFVDRYGCPFLYAECRIYYGSVLTAKGRWDDADRELNAGARITDGTCRSAGCSSAPRWTCSWTPTSTPAHQPQDGIPPRQQHPDQARAAEPGRGGRAYGTANGAAARC